MCDQTGHACRHSNWPISLHMTHLMIFLCNRINRAARARAHARRLKECAGPYLKIIVETIAIFDAMRAEGQRIQSGWGNVRWVVVTTKVSEHDVPILDLFIQT